MTAVIDRRGNAIRTRNKPAPSSSFQAEIEKGQAGGYASLQAANALIPTNQLGTGAASSTTALLGDSSWGAVATPASVTAAVNTEATARTNADNAEATARASADSTEAATRSAADTALTAAIANLTGLTKTFIREVAAALAIAATVDLNTGCTNGGSYTGTLVVSHVDQANAGLRTQTIYHVIGRASVATFTTITTANGGTGASAFTLAMTSDGVIRLTNTSGAATNAVLSSFLHQGS